MTLCALRLECTSHLARDAPPSLVARHFLLSAPMLLSSQIDRGSFHPHWNLKVTPNITSGYNDIFCLFLAKLIILCKWRIIKSNCKLGSKLQKLHLYFCILHCICFISVPTTNLHPLLLLNSFINFWGGLGPSHKLSLFVYCSPPILGAHIPNNSSLLMYYLANSKQKVRLDQPSVWHVLDIATYPIFVMIASL